MPILDPLRWLLALTAHPNQHPATAAEGETSLDHDAGVHPSPSPSPRGRPRMRLPVALSRVLGADCSSCRGLGCDMCAHTGLN